MNVFILNTGRCGSTTFTAACNHISNFSSGHETRVNQFNVERLNYPDNHIEADNRLSWFLGRLDEKYGNDAFYVHLKRNIQLTAKSYSSRLFDGGIIKAYQNGIIYNVREEVSPLDAALDYCNTVDSNIRLFLKDKVHKMDFALENAKQDFPLFWEFIGAEGNMDAALAEFEVRHNPTIKERLFSYSRISKKAARLKRKYFPSKT